MKSSRLFKMLVVAIALQASSKAISADQTRKMFGEGNSWETLCQEFKGKDLVLSRKAAIVDEFRKANTTLQKQMILENAFGVKLNSTDATLISKTFKAQISKAITYKEYATLKAAGLWKGASSYAKSAKNAIVAIPTTIKNNPKKSAAIALATVAGTVAVYKNKQAIGNGLKAAYTKVANSSVVTSASAKASAALTSVKTNASSALSWAWNKVPSMPSFRKSVAK